METEQRKVEIPFTEEEIRKAFKSISEVRSKRDFSKFNKPVGNRSVKNI